MNINLLYFTDFLAQSPILGTTIPLERLRKRGCEALLTDYRKVDLCLYVQGYENLSLPALAGRTGYSIGRWHLFVS